MLAFGLALAPPAPAADDPPPAVEEPATPLPDVSSPAERADTALAEELEAEEAEPSDPLEPVNRPVFGFNHHLDRWIFRPVARGYQWLVPEPGRRSVRNFFGNLNEPVVLVNQILQLEPLGAGETGARFLVNTTLGVAGLFDPAAHFGLDHHDEDFGQTLGKAGLGAGFYLVIPVLGPSTIRDSFGDVVDSALRIDTWLLTPGARLILAAGSGVSEREEVLDELEELERSSIDFYAAIRHLYLTTRAAAVAD
jgi:phospholipid-binding lipoprotein MlaA